ncbi:MAG: isoleucine--tRNA ligase [Candidatus Woesearchaeota archaeon]
MQNYNPIEDEEKILKFWEENKILEKAREKNKNKQKFYFLDGPPYTSGKIHLGTAWNKSLKDLVTRYKRMNGFDVWDRAGYDMHGLPTEGKVQAKLGLKTKEDILKFGLEKFVKECKDFAVSNLKQMNKDFKRLGVWLDFDNAYQTIDNDYIEGTWWLVKKAHEKKRLYQGQMTITWCYSCQTALAKHELEYKEVVDKSIYVKFKIKENKKAKNNNKAKDNVYLVIWTTTPWTIAFNLGVMVNPNVEYIKAKVDDEIWIIAKELAHDLIEEKLGKSYMVMEVLLGKELEGIEYEHPFSDILEKHYEEVRKKSKKLHVVVLSEEYVTIESGTGLVHMAPGCGPEDYEVGHREGIIPFNNVDESGFYRDMAIFTGWHAKEDNKKFIEELEKRNAIVYKEDYKHDYAHCWRCRNPVIYRTTTQWFFKVEDLIPKMRKLNKEKIYWVPDWAGSNQFDSWLENLRDNGITRQRYWGSPLPIWKCEKCNEHLVIESRKELKKYNASHIPKDLHKPWIDEVTIPCPKCKGVMKRYPDIMDVWIDAGVDSWASLGYPHKEDLFKKLYPADFITEGKDQIRGWFNLLFVASMLAMEDISFKACYMTGFVNDALGRKMSKSLGNVISPDEVTSKYGADTFRYYSIGACDPGLDLNYNFEDVEIKRRNLNILWNLHNFVLDLAKNTGKNPEKIDKKILRNASEEEHYILSKLNSTIKKVSELMDKYYLNEVPWAVENLYLELSRTYIQMVREKANSGTDEEKELVLYVVYTVMKEILLLMAPITPMITEMMYQNFKREFGDDKRLNLESIHLYDWPKYDSKLINHELEKEIGLVKDIVQGILSAREKAQIGIRWPLQKVLIETQNKEVISALKDLDKLIKRLTNVKEVSVINEFKEAELIVKPNYKELGQEFGSLSKELIKIVQKNGKEIAESIIKENNSYVVEIEGKEIKLNKKHLVIERKVGNNYSYGVFDNGNIYLDIRMNEDLINEGYLRELIRRIQSFRKEAGLKKKDTIKLYLHLDKEMTERLTKFKEELKEKVGASELFINEDSSKCKNKFEAEIKKKKIIVCF